MQNTLSSLKSLDHCASRSIVASEWPASFFAPNLICCNLEWNCFQPDHRGDCPLTCIGCQNSFISSEPRNGSPPNIYLLSPLPGVCSLLDVSSTKLLQLSPPEPDLHRLQDVPQNDIVMGSTTLGWG